MTDRFARARRNGPVGSVALSADAVAHRSEKLHEQAPQGRLRRAAKQEVTRSVGGRGSGSGARRGARPRTTQGRQECLACNSGGDSLNLGQDLFPLRVASRGCVTDAKLGEFFPPISPPADLPAPVLSCHLRVHLLSYGTPDGVRVCSSPGSFARTYTTPSDTSTGSW